MYFGAVRTRRPCPDPPVENSALAGVQVPAQPSLVLRAQRLRDEQVGDAPADNLLEGPPEERGRSGI